MTLGTSLLAGTEPPALHAPSLMMSLKTFSLGGGNMYSLLTVNCKKWERFDTWDLNF